MHVVCDDAFGSAVVRAGQRVPRHCRPGVSNSFRLGVSITVESLAMMGSQTAVTGASGGFRVPLLNRGTYTLTFSLAGFSSVVRENLEVGVRRTTTVNVTMGLSAVETTITVSGRSPMVDIKSTTRTSTYSDELRNALPESREANADFLSMAPEATPSGGSSNVQGSNFFGDNSTAFLVDGVNVSDTFSGGQNALTFYAPDMFDVVELTSIGGSADQGKYQGVVVNLVTKSGGNQYHGEGNFFYQNNAFIADNTEGINSEVCPGDDPPCFTPPSIDFRYDGSFSIGGPVIRDRMWFFASYQAFYENNTEAGVSYPIEEADNRFLGKFTFQINADNRLLVSALADTVWAPGLPQSRFRTVEQTFAEGSYSITPNITWNSVLSSNAFLEVKYSGIYGWLDIIPKNDLPQFFEDTNNIRSGGYGSSDALNPARTNIQASLSYFAEDWAGDHSFKFGAEYERVVDSFQFAYKGNLSPLTIVGSDFGDGETFAAGDIGISYITYLGDPYLAYIYNPTVSRESGVMTPFTVYAQDDWTIADRVTLNLGVRLDHWKSGYVDGRSRPNMPVLTDIAPRFGINFDLMGDGLTSLTAFVGRFYEEFRNAAMSDFDPGNATFYCLEYWGGVWEVFCREDPLRDVGFDPDLTNQYVDQFNVGIDRQITEDLVVSGRYIGKRNRNMMGGEDIRTNFSPVFVTTSSGDELQVWNAPDGLNRFRFLTNNPNEDYPQIGKSFRNYNGFQAKLVKRMSNGWSLIASLLVQESYGNNFNDTGSLSSLDSPNDFVGYPGKSGNSRLLVGKVQGTYYFRAPLELQLGFIVNALSGGPYTVTERFHSWHLPDGTTGSFGQGRNGITVPIVERGSETRDSQFRLDLRLDKRFPMRGAWGDLGLVVDIFNVFNDDTIVNFASTRIGSGVFMEPNSIAQPRIVRVGLRSQF